MIEGNLNELQVAAQRALAPYHALAIRATDILKTLELLPDLSGPDKQILLDGLTEKAAACADAADAVRDIWTAQEPIEGGE